MAGGMIRVRAGTIDGGNWQPKTKVNRAVPISSTLPGYLDAYRHRTVPGGWYFPSPEGKHWEKDNFSQDLWAVNDKAKLHWACIEYRHTFRSPLAMTGESLYKISKLMGDSPGICRRHYAALALDDWVASLSVSSLAASAA